MFFMRSPSRWLSWRTANSIAVTTILWLSPGLATPWHDASAATRGEAILYQSRDLVIYRALDRHGTPLVVLTNLDEEGHALAGPDEATPPEVSGRRSEGETCQPAALPTQGDVESPAGKQNAGGRVRVVVNRGDGQQPADQGEVEVTSEDGGGTTVVVNVNPPSRPERDTAVVPGGSGYPVLAYGGLVGPYRYPDHLYFLGYGPDTSSPSLFSGLGLNAGNHFGLRTGVSCGHGFDCMFGSPHERP